MIQFEAYKVGVVSKILILLLSFCTNAQVVILNKSFEGIMPPLANSTQPSWANCSGSPDIQPGYACITLVPSNGNAYVGIGSQSFTNGVEQIGQLLTSPLQLNNNYRLLIDLSMTNSIVLNCGGVNQGKLNFELWAGNCSCCRTKLLAKIDTINHVGWKTYTLNFVPDINYSHIIIQSNAYDLFDSKYLLIDNLSDFELFSPTINFTSPSKDTTISCIQNISGNLEGVINKVELKSTLLNKTLLATLPNSSSWSSVGFEYPESCINKKDVLEVTGYFVSGDTVTNKITVDISCTKENCGDPIIPNLITPNRDGKNDYFEILSLPEIHKLELYNRWGDKVFESSAYKNDWQGDDGVYYYLLSLEEKSFKGWLQVLK